MDGREGSRLCGLGRCTRLKVTTSCDGSSIAKRRPNAALSSLALASLALSLVLAGGSAAAAATAVASASGDGGGCGGGGDGGAGLASALARLKRPSWWFTTSKRFSGGSSTSTRSKSFATSTGAAPFSTDSCDPAAFSPTPPHLPLPLSPALSSSSSSPSLVANRTSSTSYTWALRVRCHGDDANSPRVTLCWNSPTNSPTTQLLVASWLSFFFASPVAAVRSPLFLFLLLLLF